ncbi:hypothetical protein EVAR_94901_1 [Eumeta japonica]|uniref:Uncharacterized protein n=1 Tax=Eumeta variegata TaxID=151549 RepID=A0A4C1V9W6_EUMVA|nr:hypothetical protein EVAR_94901_1 [Eumeta japonica]
MIYITVGRESSDVIAKASISEFGGSLNFTTSYCTIGDHQATCNRCQVFFPIYNSYQNGQSSTMRSEITRTYVARCFCARLPKMFTVQPFSILRHSLVIDDPFGKKKIVLFFWRFRDTPARFLINRYSMKPARAPTGAPGAVLRARPLCARVGKRNFCL